MIKKHKFGQRQKRKPLTREKLAHILRQTTFESDAAETYEKLTGEKIPENERRENDKR